MEQDLRGGVDVPDSLEIEDDPTGTVEVRPHSADETPHSGKGLVALQFMHHNPVPRVG